MTSSPQAIEKAATRLMEAAKSGQPCEPIREILAEGDVAGAYAVQETITKAALGTGRRLVGRKIGLTSLAVQKQLGVNQPDYGMLFADMDVGDDVEIPASRLIQPKVEAEIAFVIGRDLDFPDVTSGEVMRAIEFALPAIEIVDSRIAGWNIRITDTIADNASSGLFVLGTSPKKLDAFDLRLCGMVLETGGEPLSVGAGAACMGNPINAATWLAQVMAKAGRGLKAGDVILSGALGPMVGVTPGKVYEARIEGLGSVRARFGA